MEKIDPTGLPLAVAVCAGLFLNHLGSKVTAMRKTAQVPFPTLYVDQLAKEDKLKFEFNCKQRALHQTLELYPIFMVLLVIASVSAPVFSSICGSIFLAGRYFYATGYSTGEPAKRLNGSFGYLGLLGLFLTSLYTIWTFV